ncbi:hypothetical protein ABR737_03755 [Streptomyces sp. Edi2]|uniref:hypothetical protein n=1 Tax=Streptomyces sp. Edi2 TaxID=3162528 RepID=UPI0033063C4C
MQIKRHQEILFKARASHSADVTDVQLANLRLASQLGAALFRIALAEPGTEAEVTIDGRTVAYTAARDENMSPGHWQTATNFALVTDVREDLAPQVQTGPTHAHKDDSPFASYREALQQLSEGRGPPPGDAACPARRRTGQGLGLLPTTRRPLLPARRGR